MRHTVLVLVLALLAPTAARAELFADVFTGKSFTADTNLHIEQSSRRNDFTFHDVSFDDRSFDLPPYYGLRAGYFFESHPWLGVGVEYFHFKIYADTEEAKHLTGTVGGARVDRVARVDSLVQHFDVSHGVNYIMVNGIARQVFFADPERFPHGRVQLYGGGGVGPVIGHPENTVQHVDNTQQYELAGVGGQFFTGAKWLFCRWGGLYAEYKYTLSDLDVSVAGGSGDVAEQTHHIVVGLTATLPQLW